MTRRRPAIYEKTDSEHRAAEAIRTAVREAVATGRITKEEIAERLGLVTLGVENLLNKWWSLKKAWRVALHLGLEPSLSFYPQGFAAVHREDHRGEAELARNAATDS